MAFGPNTLKLGGARFRRCHPTPYFTPQTLQRCGEDRQGRRRAGIGRDPASVRVWSCFATVGDHLPGELRLKKTVARLATYLQGYGDLLVKTNDWDPAVLERFRADQVVQSVGGGIDHKRHRRADRTHRDADPRRVAGALGHRLRPAVRRPDPQGVRLRGRCADHARATPDELEPVVAAYRATV